MLGRAKKTVDDVETTTPDAVEPVLPKGYTPKKGTPTPRRKDVEAANYRPIVADRATLTREQKRLRKAEDRALRDAEWQRQQAAMRTGDERHMPAQHAGPVRRWGRDWVDARFNLASGFMAVALLLLPGFFIQARYPEFFTYFTIGLYGIFIIMIVDSVIASGRAKTLAEAHFGVGAMPRGFRWQVFGRTFYFRRWRMPRPQVGRGEWPRGGAPEDYKAARAAKAARRKASGGRRSKRKGI